LTELGYRVLVAASAQAAFDVARDEPVIDLLFTDVVLSGGVNGRELAEMLTAARPGLKVLYASGYSQDIMVERGEILPGLHFLAKPYARGALADAIRAVLDDDAAPRRAASEFVTK
jgi:CheY-like chemotaxis protein